VSETADVVIVGGGINGVVLAFHLASLGVGRVVVLDQPRSASATGKSAAILASCYPRAAEASLARAGLLSLREFSAGTGRDIGYRRVGVVRLLPEREVAAADQARGRQAANSATCLVSRDQLTELLPGGWFGDVAAAIVEPDAGFADPARTLHSYQEAARDLGVAFERRPVRRVVTCGGRVAGVEIDHGKVASRCVVIAAGAWSAGLLADLHIDLGLSVRRVQVSVFCPSPPMTVERVVLDTVQGLWLRPGAAGVLAGLEMAVPAPDPGRVIEGVDQWYVELCRTKMAARLPGLGHPVMRGGWSGLISMSRDGLPIVDIVHEYEGLFCIVGDSGSSFKAAPVIGLRMAEWITSGKPATTDIAGLSRQRPAIRPDASLAMDERFMASVRLAREARRARSRLSHDGAAEFAASSTEAR
jgi:sarcosine oxidase subunit beta